MYNYCRKKCASDRPAMYLRDYAWNVKMICGVSLMKLFGLFSNYK